MSERRPEKPPEDRRLATVAAIVGLGGIVLIALTELVASPTHSLSPGVLALVAGPVSLVITSVLLRRGGSK